MYLFGVTSVGLTEEDVDDLLRPYQLSRSRVEVTIETFTRIYQENKNHHLFSWIETLTQPGLNISDPVAPSKQEFYGFSES